MTHGAVHRERFRIVSLLVILGQHHLVRFELVLRRVWLFMDALPAPSWQLQLGMLGLAAGLVALGVWGGQFFMENDYVVYGVSVSELCSLRHSTQRSSATNRIIDHPSPDHSQRPGTQSASSHTPARALASKRHDPNLACDIELSFPSTRREVVGG